MAKSGLFCDMSSYIGELERPHFIPRCGTSLESAKSSDSPSACKPIPIVALHRKSVVNTGAASEERSSAVPSLFIAEVPLDPCDVTYGWLSLDVDQLIDLLVVTFAQLDPSNLHSQRVQWRISV